MAAYTSVQGIPLREDIVTYLRPDFPDEKIAAYFRHRAISQYDEEGRDATYLNETPPSTWWHGMHLWEQAETIDGGTWIVAMHPGEGVPAWLAAALSGHEKMVHREQDMPGPGGVLAQVPELDWLALTDEHPGAEMVPDWLPPSIESIRAAWQEAASGTRVLEVHICPSHTQPGSVQITPHMLAVAGLDEATGARITEQLSQQPEDATAYLNPGVLAALTADGQQPPAAWVFYH